MNASETNAKHTDQDTRTPLEWAEKACETLMDKFEPEQLPPERFHYHQGVFLSGMEKCWQETGKTKYYDYIKAWVDSHILEDGSITKCKTDELDDIQPGVLLYSLYEQTGDERYKKALRAGPSVKILENQSVRWVLAQRPLPEPDVAGRVVYGRPDYGSVC